MMTLRAAIATGIVVIAILLTGDYANADDGELNMIVDKFTKVMDTVEIFETNFDFFEDDTDKKYKIRGEMIQKIELNNDWKVKIVINQTNEKHSSVFAIPELGVCDFMKSIYKKYIYKSCAGYVNAPYPDTCPVKPDTYVFNNYPIDVDALKPLKKPGNFQIIGSLLKNDELQLQYVLEYHVVVDT